MFFNLSKLLWFLIEPVNFLLILICVGALLSWTMWRRAGRWLVSAAALFGLAVAILPIGKLLYIPLENRFPIVRDLPDRVDGIVVLGGVVNQVVTQARGQTSVNASIERLLEFASLAQRYPDAKLVFTGGSGDPFQQDLKEADFLKPLLDDLGLDSARIILESQSRNTFENAVFTHGVATPRPEETWILITSAFHMPRAYGSFQKNGWRVIAYPVDFSYKGDESFELTFNFRSGFSALSVGLHEWLGLGAYWLTGKTNALFPAPDG